MSHTTDTYLLLRAFVDELARCGMRAACTSPGSRCAPLVLTLASDERLRCYSHVDERCAGFFALGLAKASGVPVAVACTSGTAAAQLLAPAIEAHEARVPLLLLTADRPAELRDNGAGQAIDQIKLFGAAAKWFVEVSVNDAADQQLRWMRTLACRAYATALEGRPGVVHLNFPLREPLVSDAPLPRDRTARPGGVPFVRRHSAMAHADEASDALLAAASGAHRGIIVAGREERSGALASAAADCAEALGWPLLADPMSGARRGPAAIAHYDALLREQSWSAGVTPDLVVRVGDLPVSKPLREWLAELDGVTQIALDPHAAWQDPASIVRESLAVDAAAALDRLASTADAAATDEGWLARWREGDQLASEAIAGVLADSPLGEPSVAAELGVLLSGSSTLFVASSMPVRDIETFWPVRADPPRVLCNRGASGIDGTVSSAFGAAAAEHGPVVLLIGDVALAYDIGGLLAAGRLDLSLTIVLVNNEGGGIFDFLPVSRARMARASTLTHGESGDLYTRHVATPTSLDFAQAALLYGLGHELVDDVPALRRALGRSVDSAGASIIEARSERAGNVALHRSVWRAVARALSRRAAAGAPGA